MKKRTYYIETWGCQMNVHDSEQLADSLQRSGYRRADALESASVIILNTCSVREKAAQKVFTRLGRLAALKTVSSGDSASHALLTAPLICVAGCVAQQEGEEILQRSPAVDLVLGTRRTAEIDELLDRVLNSGEPLVAIDLDAGKHQRKDEPINRLSPWKAYVTIIEGCDNYCAYCIVPLVRGREKSRELDDVLREINQLVDGGVREVELLGQNVNSFCDSAGHDFATLLGRAADITGLSRLRFTVSHPRDFTARIARLMAEHSRVICRHLHLPLQSGSNRILKAMGRGYSREEYLEKIDFLRSLIPDIAISTDLIVGFPGETTEDFQQTLSAIRSVRYDATFSFMYNPRPGTRAARLEDDVTEEKKRQRLSQLQDLQKSIQLEIHQELVGTELEVLVQGESRRGGGQFFGRDSGNRVVNFDYSGSAERNLWPADPRGRLVRVQLTRSHPNSLFGEVRSVEDMP